MSWPNKIAIVLIRFVSSAFRAMGIRACRFYPSCSVYASDAFTQMNFFKACWLTTRRLLSCHPFCAGGFDPVPKR